jgi:hypothetical protein
MTKVCPILIVHPSSTENCAYRNPGYIIFKCRFQHSIFDVLLPKLRFLRALSSVVTRMPGYNSQRRGTARTSKISLHSFIVIYVPFSVSCELFVCKCVKYYCHRVSTQLQLNTGCFTTLWHNFRR